MNSPSQPSTHEVVEMQRSKRTGPGARILFGLISRSLDSPPPSARPIFCLCYKKGCWGSPGSWELIIDEHYNPETIRAIAENGAHMGLNDLVKEARHYAASTHPNG